MNTEQQIKYKFDRKQFVRIKRKISKKNFEISRGYIVDYSSKFILLQNCDDFRLLGYDIIQRSKIVEIRYNDNDAYYDNIMEWEGEKRKIRLKTKLDLTDWNALFLSLKRKKKYVIIENENPKKDIFLIGEIAKIKTKKVFIRYFNAQGILDETPTAIKFKNITKVVFDDRYVDVFSKYLREVEER